MKEQQIVLRDPVVEDEGDWRRLWSGYNAFYKTTVPDAVTAATWQRILDPTSAIFGRLAIIDATVAGFSVSVLHDRTWSVRRICYLEDLFVDPRYRGHGCGRLLIQDLINRAKSQGWSCLYWHTQSDNPARRLYDEFVLADDFVRYRLVFD